MNEQVPSFRLSAQQELVLAADGDLPAASQITVALPSPLGADDLRDRLERVVARHEILRTTFVRAAGARVPVAQAIHDSLPPGWTIESASDDLDALRARELKLLDLEVGPVLRVLLVELPDARNVLILTALAACADIRSLLIVTEELAGSEVAAEPLQFADYADWRGEILAAEDAEGSSARDAWTQTLEDLPDPGRVLFGVPADGAQRKREQLPVELGSADVEALRPAAGALRVPVELFVEAAWHALIARLTGTDRVAVAALADGRSQAELERAVGPYAQPLPIRTRIEDETSFAEVVDQVRRERSAVARRQDYVSGRQLVAVCEGLSLGFAAFDVADAAGIELIALESTASAPALQLVWLGDGRAILDFDPEAYSRRDVAQVENHLRTLITAAAADATQPVSRLTVVGDEERRSLVSLAAGPEADIPPRTLHELFEEQASLTPDLPAVAAGDESVSYHELNQRANRLAHHLRALGVARDVPVGLCLDRSPAMLTALLAILKAGGAYLPLNFEHPHSRLAHQIDESGAHVVVTQAVLRERLPAGITVVCVDEAEDEIATQPSSNPDHVNEPDDLVYVMYTSGSTGLPKGVAVTHRNVVNYTTALSPRFASQGPLNFAVVSAISTDLGNTAIFPALISGGCVHLIDPQTSMDGEAFAAYAAQNPIDVLKITPSHLRALLRAGSGFLPRRWLVLGGEASSWELIDDIRAVGAGCRILNHYGPTETTIGCCTFEVDGPVPEGLPATVPIGRPISNLRAYILDQQGDPVPVGVAGELCVGGAGVARGYVNRPDETNGRFVPDSFANDGRVYRTGDRARFLPDGNIEFLGRIDEQLKIRGFRVEPGEIEAALARHPAISEAAVVAQQDGDGDPRLVAYLVAASQPNTGELRAFLSESLPEFMIPAHFEPIDVLPLTPSGKIDRRALPEPGRSSGPREREYVAPRDDLEAEIAAIWEQLLSVEQVGVNDDFFALGGHSLLATQAIIRIRRTHGDLPLGALFNASTVATLADVIRRSQPAPFAAESAS
jgi:amino acid adenylation domain-containing protein